MDILRSILWIGILVVVWFVKVEAGGEGPIGKLIDQIVSALGVH